MNSKELESFYEKRIKNINNRIKSLEEKIEGFKIDLEIKKLLNIFAQPNNSKHGNRRI